MIASTLRNSLQGHASRLIAAAEAHGARERRAKMLTELRRIEETELASLTAFKTEFEGTLKQLIGVDWSTLGRAVNIGFNGATVDAEVGSLLSDVDAGIQFHEDVLATFAQDSEPSDAVLERAVELRGLADRLRERVQALHDSVSKL
jgi:hypothetical protein